MGGAGLLWIFAPTADSWALIWLRSIARLIAATMIAHTSPIPARKNVVCTPSGPTKPLPL